MDWPLIGRDVLITNVMAAVQDVPGGALLDGDLGVGKTRLALEVANQLRDAG